MKQYTLLQLPANSRYFLRGYVEKDLPRLEDYVGVYTDNVEDEIDRHICERLFEKFNVDKLRDELKHFAGYSMSVGDVVCLEYDSERHYYYCDHIGFVELDAEEFEKSY